MKLRAEQLTAHLRSGNLAPFYLISGDEMLLVDEACQAIRQATHKKGFVERSIFQVDNHFNWQEFLTGSYNLSLFAQKTLLELHIASGKINAEASEILLRYTQLPIADKILLIKMQKLETSTQKAKWLQAIEASGVIVQIWPITTEQMPAWLRQRLQQVGLTIENTALQVLCEYMEGNLSAANQEVEKLRLLYDENHHLTLQDINTAVENNARYDIFNLIDAILAMHVQRVSKILMTLRQEGIEPTLVLWAITREIRSLIFILNKVQAGQDLLQVFRQQGIWEKRQLLIKNYLRQLSSLLSQSSSGDSIVGSNVTRSSPASIASSNMSQISFRGSVAASHTPQLSSRGLTARSIKEINHFYTALQQAADIDQIIKGLAAGSVWDELLKLCLQLTGKF